MIPAGRTAATSQRAAEILGTSLSNFRNKKLWEKIPATVKTFHRSDSKRPVRLWDEEQLQAYADQRELPFDQQKIPVMPVDPHNPRRQDLSDDDLLDVREAWEAMPEDDRPTYKTWEGYVGRRDEDRPETTGPAHKVDYNGFKYWRRGDVVDWCVNRTRQGEAKTGGRPKGSKNTVPTIRPNAIARKAAAKGLLQQLPDLPQAQMVKTIAQTQNVTERQALRILNEVRAELEAAGEATTEG